MQAKGNRLLFRSRKEEEEFGSTERDDSGEWVGRCVFLTFKDYLNYGGLSLQGT